MYVCMYIYIYMSLSLSIYIYIYIYVALRFGGACAGAEQIKIHQRGGAVETGCSDLYDVIY